MFAPRALNTVQSRYRVMSFSCESMHSMQLSSPYALCRSCHFRRSRPRLSRRGARAQALNSARTEQHSKAISADSLDAEVETGSSKNTRGPSLTSPSVVKAPQESEAERLTAYGDSQASDETKGLLSAVNKIRQAAQTSSSSTKREDAKQQQNPAVSPQAAPESSSGASQVASSSTGPAQGPGPPKTALSKADMLAKLAQAKAYKQDKGKRGGVPVIVDTKSIAQQTADPPHAPLQPTDSFSSTHRRPQQSQVSVTNTQDPAGQQSPGSEDQAGGVGSAAQPARFLEQAMQKQSEDSKSMSEEAYSLLKEKQKRSQKVDIISVDKSYNKGNKVMDPAYNPKVATWGVFERPANISEAYGGGRTIKAGTPLEDATVTQARKDRIAAALSRYKRDAALEIDPAVQLQCEAAFAQGEELFHNKQVAAALVKYAVAAELMPVKTALGGRARLQKAICLDSLGQNKEAYAVYLLIQTHPLPEVAKQAKRMIFGFKAMDNLKAHTMSYSVSKGAYEQYFNRFTGDWNSSYVSTDDDSDEITKTAVIACAVMLAPIIFLVARILL